MQRVHLRAPLDGLKQEMANMKAGEGAGGRKSSLQFCRPGWTFGMEISH